MINEGAALFLAGFGVGAIHMIVLWRITKSVKPDPRWLTAEIQAATNYILNHFTVEGKLLGFTASDVEVVQRRIRKTHQ